MSPGATLVLGVFGENLSNTPRTRVGPGCFDLMLARNQCGSENLFGTKKNLIESLDCHQKLRFQVWLRLVEA